MKVEIDVSKEEIIQIFACINTFIFAVRIAAPIPGVDIVGNVLMRLLSACHKKIKQERNDVGFKG
jgi:hypothetical protein